jgi:hypothetical protein
VTVAAWIALGVVALGLLLLAWMLSSLLRRLLSLRSAAQGLQNRAEQGVLLQQQLEDLQPRVLELNLRLERVKAKLPHR